MKFKDKLIVSDIDGTFFNSKSQVVPRNLEAVEYFKRNGGRFTIATGRVPESMGRLAPYIETLANSPVICCNGAVSYDFVNHIRTGDVTIDSVRASELIHLVERDFPAIGIRISSRTGYLIPRLNDYIVRELADHVERLKADDMYHVGEREELTPEGWTRVAFCAASDELDRLRAAVEGEYSKYFSFSKASAEIYEFQDGSATKGTAIDKLRRYLISSGAASESLCVYAVGDYENDLDMLRRCDIPACPSNAIPAVKDIAKIQLCFCDDGAIADLIEKIEAGL